MQTPALELASDLARIRAIYKLTPLPSPVTVLEILSINATSVVGSEGTTDEPMLVLSRVDTFGYADLERTEIARYPVNALFDLHGNGVSAQLIIMHGTWAPLQAALEKSNQARDRDHIFGAFNDILTSGGVLAGCFENYWGMGRFINRGTPRDGSQRDRLSLGALRALLKGHSFAKPRLFALYPGMASPLTLAQVNDSPSIKYSFGQVRFLENWLGKGNYSLKVLLSMLGVALNFDDEYFFFALKK